MDTQSFAWSPDGTRLALVSQQPKPANRYQVSTVVIATGERRILGDGPGVSA